MPTKFDGVIEAVRYASDGKILMVRAYERRGPTFSDQVLIERPALLERLKNGKTYVIGRRTEFLGSTFETGAKLILVGDFITTNPGANRDSLEAVPLF